MALDYVGNVLEKAPPWLQGPTGKAWLSALAGQKDWLADVVRDAVKARFPGYAGVPVDEHTNSALWSTAETNAAVTATRLTVSAAGTGPFDQPAFLLTLDSTAANFHFTTRASVGSMPVGQVSLSRYVKAQGAQGVMLTVQSNGAGNGAYWGFNLRDGIVGWDNGQDHWGTFRLLSKSMTAVGGGWYLCTITVQTGAAGVLQALSYIGVLTPDGNNPTKMIVSGVVDGDGASGILVSGCQLEVGVPTVPLIPTTTAAVTYPASVEGLAPDDALVLIGAERGLPRGAGEAEAGYRTRLQQALALWSWAGTPYGLLNSMALAGFPAVRLQCQSGQQYTLGTDGRLLISALTAPVHLGGSPECWSDFGVLIGPPWPAWWNGIAPADGSPDCLTVQSIIRTWKGAVNRCVKLACVTGALWGDAGLTWGTGVWGGGTYTNWTPPTG